MKKFLLLILLLINGLTYGQCVGNQTFSLNPVPPAGGYLPGTTVTVCYTMTGWNGWNVGSNWLEGFDINLGPGWTNLTPMAPPQNCAQSAGGTWLWMNVVNTSQGPVGPGWFFEINQGGPVDGNPANDWGDYGTNCVWSFCFQVTTAQGCTPLNLLIQVTAGADGDWGSWNMNACPTNPFNIYNGNINATLPGITNISHN